MNRVFVFLSSLVVAVYANDEERDPLINKIYKAHERDDLYGVLGVGPRAKVSQLKGAYRKLAKRVRAAK